MEPFVTRIGDVTIERVMPRGGPTKELKKDVTLTPCKSSPSEGEGIPLNDDLQIFIKPPLEHESGKSPKDGRDKKEPEASNSDIKKDSSKTAGSSDKMSTDGEESDNEDSEMEDESVDKNDKTKSDSESEVKDNPQDSKCESTIDRTEDSEKKNDDGSPAQSGEAEPAPNSDSKSGSQDKDRGDTSKRKASGDGSGSSGSNVGAVKKKKKSGQDGSKDSKSSSSSSDSGDDGDGKSTMERKLSNMRRNIREVMSENQLDEETLAAQRQEMERLRRVQEQQRIIREVQRQIALNRQNNKTQNRVISILQGNSSILKQIPGTSGSSGTQVKLPNTVLVKLASGASNTTSNAANTQGNKKQLIEFLRVQKNVSAGRGSVQPSVTRTILGNKPRAGPGQVHMMTPSVSIAPVSSSFPARQMQHQMETDSDSDDDYESETEAARAAMRKVAGKPKGKDVVTTISSSSDDDCILLSEPSSGDEEPVDDPTNSGMHTNDLYNIPDEQGRVLVNVGHPAEEPDIFVAAQIARIIKPHQIGGVRFLYDNVVESTTRFNTSTGFGCILAHSMGLGKTLQVVCFCDIFLRHTPGRTVLCIMPINTLQNWMAEFNMWLPGEPDPANGPPPNTQGEVRTRNFPLHVLNDSHKSMSARARVIQDWNKDGGVLLIGYELYRQLSLKRSSKVKKSRRSRKPDETIEVEEDEKTKALLDEMHAALVKPGPDLVICDEGHRIKNSHASISQALKQIRSKRRVVLTGYPLQNNLLEYWCMVDFVRPNYLGTKTEFCNMFERPIQNGQCIDSTPQDIRLMRYRAHVLHSLLEGFVQRRSHSVLQVSLPQKNEYVLLLRMTAFQRKLYDTFMNEVVRTKAVPNPLKAFAVCCKIWNHPDILYFFLKKRNLSEDADLDLEETTSTTSTPSTPLGVGSPKGPAAGKRGKVKLCLRMRENSFETKENAYNCRDRVTFCVRASTTLRGKKPAATIPPNTSTAVSDPNTPAPSEGSQPSQNVPYDQSYTTQQNQSYDNASQYNSYQQGSNSQMPYRNPGYGPNTGPNYDPNTYSGIGSYDAGNSGNSYNNCADPNNPNSDGFGGSSNSYYPNNSGNQQSGFESQMGYNYQQGNNQSEYQCDPNLNSGNSGYWQSNDYYTQNPQNQSGNDNSNQYYGSNNTYNNSGNTSYYHNPNQPYDNQLGNNPYGGTVQQQNSNQSGGMYQNMSGDNQGYVGNSSASGTPGGIQQSSTGVQQTRTNDGVTNQQPLNNQVSMVTPMNSQQNTMNLPQNSSNPQQNTINMAQNSLNNQQNSINLQHGSINPMNNSMNLPQNLMNNQQNSLNNPMNLPQNSMGIQQNPMNVTQNLMNNQQNPTNNPTNLPQNPINTQQNPMNNSRPLPQNPITNQQNPITLPQNSMGTQQSPMNLPQNPMTNPQNAMNISSNLTQNPLNNTSNPLQNSMSEPNSQNTLNGVTTQPNLMGNSTSILPNSVNSLTNQQGTMGNMNNSMSLHHPLGINSQQNNLAAMGNPLTTQLNPINNMANPINNQQNFMSNPSQPNPIGNQGNNQHNSMGNPMINQSSINNQQTSSNPMDVQQNPLGPGIIPQNSMSSPMIGQHSSMGNQNPINSTSNTIQSNTAGTDPSSMTSQQYSSSNEQDPMGNLQNMLDNQPNAINSMETSQSPLGNLQNMIGNTPTSLGHIPNQYSGNMGSFGNNFNTFGGNAFGMGGTQPVPYNSGNHQTTNPMSNTPNMAFGTNNNLSQANSSNPPNTQYGTGNPQVNQVNPMGTRMGNPLPSMGIQSNSMNNQQNPTYGMGNSPISLENHDSSLNNPQNPAYGSGIHHTSVGNQGNSMISQGNSGYGMNNLQSKSEIQGNSNNPQNPVMNHQGFHHSGGMMSLNCSSSNQEGIYNPPWDPSQPPLNPGTIKEELTNNSGVSQKILSQFGEISLTSVKTDPGVKSENPQTSDTKTIAKLEGNANETKTQNCGLLKQEGNEDKESISLINDSKVEPKSDTLTNSLKTEDLGTSISESQSKGETPSVDDDKMNPPDKLNKKCDNDGLNDSNEGSKDDKEEEKTLSSESFSKVDGAECKDASSSTNLDGMKDLGLPEGKPLAEMGTVPRNNEPGIPYDWAVELLKNYIPGSLENSAKMEVLFCILEEAMMLGDRLLVFSQSLFTLDLIEDFLQRCTLPGHEEKWARNVNYYRLDGSTSALEREKLINEYNSNPNIHLFLVSTRAGSLGINLVGANRVVVFDASWNPCHDTQAVCRVYRYGQKKPCFVYRLVMDNCLEKKIYDRQINKQGMADRVVDECNPDAHLSIKDVTNLCWDNEQETEVKDFSKDKDKYIDVVIQKVLDKYSASLSKEPFQHESLLVDRKEKKLSQAEKRLAKRSYELEKQASINYNRPQYSYYPAGAGIGNAGLQSGLQIRAIRTDGGGGVMPKPVASVRPMQAELNSQLERGPRSTISTMNTGRSRWIPAEVWQRQGMSAQEMTLPLDVVIPTNSPDRASIVLKAGQRVMVLKSPKGIYMQLENGKIIAIRTAFKVGGAGKGANVQDKVEKEGEIKPSDIKKDYNIPSNPGQRPNTKISNVLPFKNNSAITIIPKGNTPTPSRSTTPNRPMGKTLTMTRQETAVKPWIHSERSPSMIRQRGGMFAGKLTAETRPFFQQGMTRRSPATGHQLTGTAKPFFHRNKKITSGPNSLEFGNQHTQSSNSDDTSSGAENILESSGTNLRDDGDNTKSPSSSLDFHGEARFNRGGDDAEQDSSCEDAGNFPMSSEEFSSKHLQDEQNENSGYQESVDKRDWPLRTDSSGFPPENSGYQSENRSWEASPQGSRDSIPNFQHSNTGTFPVDTTNWERKSKSQATKEHTSGNFRVDDVNYRVARGNWNPSENVQDDDERNWQAQNEDTSPRKGNYFAGTTANSPTKWPITPSQSTQDHKDVDYFDDGQSFPQENRDWRLDPGQRSNQFHNDTSKYSEPAESRNWSHSRNEIQNIQRVPKPFDGGSSKNVQGGGNRNFSSPDDDKDHGTPGPNISHHHNFPPKSFTSNFGHLNDGRQPETLLSPETKSPVQSPSVDFHRHETTQNIEPTPPQPRPQQSKGSSLKNYRHAAFAQNAHRKEMEARAENPVTSAVPPLNSTIGGQSLKSQSFVNEKTSSYGNEKLTKPSLGFHDGSLKPIQSYPVYESRVQPRNETMSKFTESNVAHDSLSTKNKQSVKTDSHYDYIPAHGEIHRREDNLSKLYPAVSIEPVLPVSKKSSKGSKSAKQPANYPGNFDTEHVTPPLLKPPHGKTPTTEALTPSFPTTPSSELGPPPVDSSKLPDSYGGTQYGHNYLGGSGFYGYGHQGASPVMPFGGSYYGDAHEKSTHPASYQEKNGDQVSETKSPPQQGKSPSARRESNKSSSDSKRDSKASSSSGKDDARSAGSPGSASGSRTSNNSARSTQASANPTSSSLDSAVPSQSNTSSPNFSPYSSSTVSSTGIPYESVLNSYSSSQYNSTGTNSTTASNPFTPSATGYAAPLRPSSSASAVPPYVTPGAYGSTVPYTAGTPNQYDSDYARASMYSAFHRPEPHHFPVPPTDIGSPFLTSITPSTNPPPFGLPAAATFPATSSASPHAANYYPQNMYAASPYAARPGYSPTDPGYYSAAPGGFNPFFSHQHPYAGLQPPAATPQNPERPAQ
uniref:Helicase ARIP4 n=1 Tax=Timema douglasi TaxID=61478 RepID=A0A7R8VBR5_TIMDO|nr:unnamed protein product [Timema douglasi]